MLAYADFWLIVNGMSDAYLVEAEGPGEIRVPPVPFVFRQTPELEQALAALEAGDDMTRDRLALIGERLREHLTGEPERHPRPTPR